MIVVGLDNSGKSTIINKLKPEASQSHSIVPTVGFSVETVTHPGMRFTMFDMSGQSK